MSADRPDRERCTGVIMGARAPGGMQLPPVGMRSFREIREGDYAYIDRTMLASEILDARLKATLIVRPRRFGKSVNLSMLDAYLNLEYAGNHWFDGLRISDARPDDPDKNAYPVIYLDLRTVECGSVEGFIASMRMLMSDMYRRLSYLRDDGTLQEVERTYFDDILNGRSSVIGLKSSLRYLSDMMCSHHGKGTVILIDEYDNPVNNAADQTVRRGILDFLSMFLSGALKGNESLGFAVVTGILQISKESMFPGLNNITVNNIFDTRFDEMYGFTADEVRGLCSAYGQPERFEEARRWYDGYRFGNAEVYNPWSIMNYVQSGFVAEPYWINTSRNEMIRDLL